MHEIELIEHMFMSIIFTMKKKCPNELDSIVRDMEQYFLRLCSLSKVLYELQEVKQK